MKRQYHRRAYTLAELIIALIITSFLTLGIASMLYATNYATSSRHEMRRLVVRQERLKAQFSDAIRNARTILGMDNDCVVLWQHDNRQNNQVNLSELQMIIFNRESSTLTSHTAKFPDSMTEPEKEAADINYPADTDFVAAAKTAVGGSYFPGKAWSKTIEHFSLSLDDPIPQSARLVNWSMRIKDADLQEEFYGTTALRAPITPE